MQVVFWNKDKTEATTYAELQVQEKSNNISVSSSIHLPSSVTCTLPDIIEAVYNESGAYLGWEVIDDVPLVSLPDVKDLPVPNFINIERENRVKASEFLNNSVRVAVLDKMKTATTHPKGGIFRTSIKDPNIEKPVLELAKEMAKELGYTLTDSHDGGGLYYVLSISWQIDLDKLAD